VISCCLFTFFWQFNSFLTSKLTDNRHQLTLIKFNKFTNDKSDESLYNHSDNMKGTVVLFDNTWTNKTSL